MDPEQRLRAVYASFNARDIDAADVIGKVLAVPQRVIFGLTVFEVQPHGHRHGLLLAEGKSPTTHAAEQVHCCGRRPVAVLLGR